MKFTVKHYHYFEQMDGKGQQLANVQGWDHLYIDSEDNFYFIPGERKEWEKKRARHPELAENARDIIEIARENNFKRINSVGVCTALLELNLKKQAPDIYLACSDYTPGAMKRLRHIFSECEECNVFDMLEDEWKPVDNTLWLMFRVDTEFSDEQWKSLFSRMSGAGIKDVLFVPSVFFGWYYFLSEIVVNTWHRLNGRHPSFAGYVRTRDTVKSFWAGNYRLNKQYALGKLTGYLLEKI